MTRDKISNFDKEYVYPIGKHNRIYETKEEAYDAHKKRVAAHQRKNPEANRARVKKYNARPDIKEKNRLKYLTANLTEEQILERNRKQREGYKRKVERESKEME
jgi:hypothetical protein